MWFESIRTDAPNWDAPNWDAKEWIIKAGLFLFLAGILILIAFKPADPAAYAEEPWSFSHNLFICTFDDPADRQQIINPPVDADEFE